MLWIALVLAGAPPQTLKDSIQMYGFTDTSCADLKRMPSGSANRHALEGWTFGFVSGLNAFDPKTEDISPNSKATDLTGWVDSYCKRNPLDSFMQANFKLVDDLRRRAHR